MEGICVRNFQVEKIRCICMYPQVTAFSGKDVRGVKKPIPTLSTALCLSVPFFQGLNSKYSMRQPSMLVTRKKEKIKETKSAE